MMITPLLVILLLLPLSVSAGELDEKGWIYEDDDDLRGNPVIGTMILGVQLAGGFAQTEVMRYRDGVATFGMCGVAIEYEAMPTQITWARMSILEKQTLKLSEKAVRLTYEYRCEVFANSKQYKRGVEKRRETEQTIIDNVMGVNKI